MLKTISRFITNTSKIQIIKIIVNMDNLISSKSKISIYDEKIKVYNFIQGGIVNCGMISSITLLANKDLCNKVVQTGQNFDSKNSLNVVYKSI